MYGYANSYDKSGKIVEVIRAHKDLFPDSKCTQIFLKNPSKVDFSKLSQDKIAELTKEIALDPTCHVYIHSPMNINLARDVEKAYGINLLVSDLFIANQIGAKGVVVHMGKTNINKVKIDDQVGLENMYKSIEITMNEYAAKCKAADVPMKTKLLLETAAGQGSELCYDIAQLAAFWNTLNTRMNTVLIDFCIDTCHIFAAGNDISNDPQGFIDKWEKLITWDRVGLIHLNDSKDVCGAKKDRHELLGKGHIGRNGLSVIIKKAFEKNIPMVMEIEYSFYKDKDGNERDEQMEFLSKLHTEQCNTVKGREANNVTPPAF